MSFLKTEDDKWWDTLSKEEQEEIMIILGIDLAEGEDDE